MDLRFLKGINWSEYYKLLIGLAFIIIVFIFVSDFLFDPKKEWRKLKERIKRSSVFLAVRSLFRGL